MKKIFRCALCAMAAAVMSGCEIFGDIFDPSYVALEDESQQTSRVGPEEFTFTIAVKSNTEWFAVSDKKWCRPLQYDKGVLTVSVEENYGDAVRTAYITLETKDGVGKLEIAVIQREKYEVTVSQGDYHEVPKDGGTFDVTLQHNVAYDVEIPESVTWIHEVKSKALTTKVHTFSVDSNTTGVDRTANLFFTSADGGISERVIVKQLGKLPKRQFGFKVIHSNMSFEEPLMTGDFTGNVFWKHGQSTPLGTYPEYTYTQSGEKTVVFDMFGQAEEFTVEFRSLEGISEIDFSGM